MCKMVHFTHILPQPILQKMIVEVVLKLLLPVVHVFREGRAGGLKYQYSVIPKSGTGCNDNIIYPGLNNFYL